MQRPPTPEELSNAEQAIDAWLADQLAENPVVAAVHKEMDPGGVTRRWYVRVLGEEKDVFTVWFTLHQRNLHFETYFMPAPEENEAELYEHLLRRNMRVGAGAFGGIAFAIGVEDAVFLVGELPVHAVEEVALDRVLGSLYACAEQCFRPAMRIGFRSRFKG